MLFSIIVTALNPGNKMERTVRSILNQSYTDYEIIVKDGGSKDGSLEKLPKNDKIKVFCKKDSGIYEGMNQAIEESTGEYLLFLNCGDTFFNEEVLKNTVENMKMHHVLVDSVVNEKIPEESNIFYGDTFCEQTVELETSPPVINAFSCYRNIPCHQSCFYHRSLFSEKRYDLQYKIRADYDHFLWCYFTKKATIRPMSLIVSSYEGGGYSENKANRKKDRQEHRAIINTYMTRMQILKYDLIMIITLAPLRKLIANSKHLSGIYQKIKRTLYRR